MSEIDPQQHFFRQNPKCRMYLLLCLNIDTLSEMHQDTDQLSIAVMIDKSAVVNNNGFIDFYYWC